MKKIPLPIIILIALLVFIGIYSINPSESSAAMTKSNFVVFLYPGHSPASNSKFEAMLNEYVTQRVYTQLTSRGYTVYITNPMGKVSGLPTILTEAPSSSQYAFSTQLLPAINTPNKYNASIPNADLVIGIHHNSQSGYSLDDDPPKGTTNGYELYYDSSLGGTSLGNPYGKDTASVAHSLAFGQMLNTQLNHDFYLTQRGSEPRNVVDYPSVSNSVITYSKVPSLIIEAGYMTNANDRAKITQGSNMDILASRIANAVDAYYAQYVDATPPTITGVSPAVGANTAEAFMIQANGVTDPSGVASVQFAVWSEHNGQDDLKFYGTTPDGSGNYAAIINAYTDHNNDSGKYYIDIYATDTKGNRGFMGQTYVNVQTDKTSPTITSVSPAVGANTADIFFIQANGVTDPSGVASVQFAVWSEKNGQDDLAFYGSTPDGSGNYAAIINAANHKNNGGKYFIDIYTTDKRGNRGFVGQTYIYVNTDNTAPTITGVTPAVGANANDIFFIQANGVSDPSGVASVQFAIWSDKNGQDDLKFYGSTPDGSGNYTAIINAYVGHQNVGGKYYIDIYTTDKRGNRGFVGQTYIYVNTDNKAPTITGVTPAVGANAADVFFIQANGVSDPSGVANVQFAVWSQTNGQDDLAFYGSTSDGNGNYTAYINTINHKNNSGKYFIDIYTTDGKGNRAFVGQTYIYVAADETPPTITGITPAVGANAADTFFIQANGVSDPSGVANVQFAVWSEINGQDDLKFYGSTPDGSGNYAAIINAYTDHKNNGGKYFIDIYTTDKKGNRGFVGQTYIYVNPDNTAPTITGVTPAVGANTADIFFIQANGVSDPSGVANVQFAVWSEKNGQDDLAFYSSTSDGNGNYSAVINAVNHKNNNGKYFIDIYTTDKKGNRAFVGQTYIIVQSDDVIPTMSSVSPAVGANTADIFSIQANGVTDASGVASVKFIVWSEKNGQDDIKTYSASSDGNGNWSKIINAADHSNSSGKYNIDIYATDNKGNSGLIGQTYLYVQADDQLPNVESIAPAAGSGAAQTFLLQANNVTDTSGVSYVQFAVWSAANGQDDIRLYNAVSDGHNNWSYTVDAAYHKYDRGLYYVDVRAKDNKGNEGVIAQTTLYVDFVISGYNITGTSNTNAEQLVRYFQSSGNVFPEYYNQFGVDLAAFCRIYMEECTAEGIRAEVAFAQMVHETGWLKFGNIVNVTQFNFAGLGATDTTAAGQAYNFATVYGLSSDGLRMGIRAHIQHLKCYASTDALVNPCVDPRFDLAAAAYGRGSAPTVESLSGKWASWVEGAALTDQYGFQILAKVNSLLAK